MLQGGAIGLAAARFQEFLTRFWRDQDGLTTVEYSLLLALLVIGGAVAFAGLGSSVSSGVGDAANSIDQGSGPGGGAGC